MNNNKLIEVLQEQEKLYNSFYNKPFFDTIQPLIKLHKTTIVPKGIFEHINHQLDIIRKPLLNNKTILDQINQTIQISPFYSIRAKETIEIIENDINNTTTTEDKAEINALISDTAENIAKNIKLSRQILGIICYYKKYTISVQIDNLLCKIGIKNDLGRFFIKDISKKRNSYSFDINHISKLSVKRTKALLNLLHITLQQVELYNLRIKRAVQLDINKLDNSLQ